MKMSKNVLPLVAALLCASPVTAQTNQQTTTKQVEEQRHEADIDRRLAEAEKRMAEAAREMAQLTTERLPQIARFERRIELSNRPRLGVAIGGADEDGPVEGVNIMAVTPGTAASDAGLRAGDVITSINKEALSAASAEAANQKLLDFMAGVEEGDALDVEYLRNGKVGKVEVMPKVMPDRVFAWSGDGGDFEFHGLPPVPGAPGVHVAPNMGQAFNFAFRFAGNGLGNMELVELSEGLGRYFGTDRGLLVVKAPESKDLQLQDGDVIQSIDGRVPNSVRHALQILGSYQAGEKLELQIMRDKKGKKLSIEMPDGRSSMLFDNSIAPVQPAAMPVRSPAPVIATERT